MAVKVVLTLDNVVLPPEKLAESPSFKDGLDKEVEMDLRLLGCELIQASGILLRLPQVAMATGQILFQRFYYCESFIRHNMEYTAMASIALASKIEEAPRRLRDVINVFNHLKQLRTGKKVEPIPLDSSYIRLKNNVIKSERKLLKDLGFCVHIKHPHKFVVILLQSVLSLVQNSDLLQLSWNYMNDSLRTDVFLRYSPETIAVSCIYLAARVIKIGLPSSPPWFHLFDLEESAIRDVCKRILVVYTRPKPDQMFLEQLVENMRSNLDKDRLHPINYNPTSAGNTPETRDSQHKKTTEMEDESQDSIPRVEHHKELEEERGSDKGPSNLQENEDATQSEREPFSIKHSEDGDEGDEPMMVHHSVAETEQERDIEMRESEGSSYSLHPRKSTNKRSPDSRGRDYKDYYQSKDNKDKDRDLKDYHSSSSTSRDQTKRDKWDRKKPRTDYEEDYYEENERKKYAPSRSRDKRSRSRDRRSRSRERRDHDRKYERRDDRYGRDVHRKH